MICGAAVGELINNQLPIVRPGWPMGHTLTGIGFSEAEHAVERLLGSGASSNIFLAIAAAVLQCCLNTINITLHQLPIVPNSSLLKAGAIASTS